MNIFHEEIIRFLSSDSMAFLSSFPYNDSRMNDLVVDLGAHVLFSIAAGLLAWKIYGSKGWQSLFVAQLFAFLSGLFIHKREI
jgi:hypothetical protein